MNIAEVVTVWAPIIEALPQTTHQIVQSRGVGSWQRTSRSAEQRRKMYFCQCSRCGKVYQTKGSLTRHLKFECTSVKLFNCGHCDYSTKHPYDVVTHCKRRHSNLESSVLQLKDGHWVEWRSKSYRSPKK